MSDAYDTPEDLLAIDAAELEALAVPPSRDVVSGLLDGLVVGQWELGALIGAGGMGEVYRATHAETGAKAAVKVLRAAPWLAGGLVERFRREVRVALAINHPNVVSVLDAGEHAGTWWLAMSLVEGESLQRWVEANGPLPWRLALRVVAQAACGLQAAHDNCIVHRDVKPANVLLGATGRVRIADFGIAADPGATGSLTLTGQALGTPAFMSPEQCTNGTVDARSDLYALGATLFFCLTGTPPFQPTATGGALALLEQQVRAPAPRADQRNPDVPRAAATIVAKLLEKPPAARYQSAANLVADIAAVLAGGEPTLAAGDDTSVRYTRAFVDADVSEDEVEACLADQAAARARGERPVPLGEMLARRGAVEFRARAASVAGRAARDLACPACDPATPVARFAAPLPTCPVCDGALVAEGGIALGEAYGRLVLIPSADTPELGQHLVPLLAAALQEGFLHSAVDCSGLGRLEQDQAIWIADALEMLLAEGGSLALVVPEARTRGFLAAVGIDQYVRVVDARQALFTVRPRGTTHSVVREEPTPVG